MQSVTYLSTTILPCWRQSMLKPIFDEDVDFFSKKIILCAKGGDFKKGALDSDFMFVNIEPYKSKKCVPY